MPTLFDKERRRTEGEKVLRSKTKWKANIKTIQDQMFLDIILDDAHLIKKLGSCIDALSRLDSGMTRMEVIRSKIEDKKYQQHLKALQEFKQYGFDDLYSFPPLFLYVFFILKF